MRKKLDTRFPAPRIKKIMQSDEDIGKIAMAVPLLVSKALELFLQDLCERTYDITLKKGAKTVNSLHLKQCVQRFKLFDFLKDTVSKVPDLGGGSDAIPEDKLVTKRKKISEDKDEDNNHLEYKRTTMPFEEKSVLHETGHVSSNGKNGKRGRGRPRGKRTIEKFEDVVDNEDHKEVPMIRHGIDSDKPVRNFDLNVEPNEDGDSLLAPCDSVLKQAHDEKQDDEISGWSKEMERMATVADFNGGIDEFEDYDEEDGEV